MAPYNLNRSVHEEDLPDFLRILLSTTQSFEKDLGYLVEDTEKAHVYCMDALIVIDMINRLGNLDIALPELEGDKESDIEKIRSIVEELEQKTISAIEVFGTEEDRELISREKKGESVYEFSDNDHERVQQLINELRQIVTKASSIDEDHRSRLLRRLEKLQAELHKHLSNFDRFWGLLGDAGEAIGKFGEDTKPFVDRVKELLEIVRKTQSKGYKSLERSEADKLPEPECFDETDSD